MAVPPVLSDLVSAPNAPQRSGQGGRTADQSSTRFRTTSPRWSFQFTPTQASWLNQLEISLVKMGCLSRRRCRIEKKTDLAQQMLAYIETYNQTAKPFKWTYAGKTLEA
jgi:hypothetical protein